MKAKIIQISLPEKQFKVTLIKMLTELIRRMDEHSENVNKKVENRKKNQLELQNTIMEMKHTVEWVNSGLDDSEEGSTVTRPVCHNY